jgi:hypothetical protein
MKIRHFCLFIFIVILSQHISAEALGDASGDGQIDIVDALVIAQYYVGLLSNEIILSNSDVNADGEVDIVDALLVAQYYVNLISCFPPGCPSPQPTIPLPSGSLISVEGCLETTDGIEDTDITTREECLSYNYSGADQILLLSHLHAGFNCCVSPTGEINIEGSTIKIIESFTGEDICDCECLFNLNYKLTNVVPGVYTFSVNSVYFFPEELTFTVDLSSENEGIYCIFRDQYPWM